MTTIRFYTDDFGVEAQDDLPNHHLAWYLMAEVPTIANCKRLINIIDSVLAGMREPHYGVGNMFEITIEPRKVTVSDEIAGGANPEFVPTELPVNEYRQLLQHWMLFLESDGSEVHYQVRLLDE